MLSFWAQGDVSACKTGYSIHDVGFTHNNTFFQEKYEAGMSSSKRGSEWLVLRRCLAILNRLLRGPASANELISIVRELCGPDAYPQNEATCKRAFKRDRRNLRKRLGVEFYYDPAPGKYILQDSGPYLRFQLSEESLFALGLLSQTFEGQVGERAEIQKMLEEIISRLSPETKRQLETGRYPINMDVLQEVDQAPVSERIWQTVNRAVRERRQLAFQHTSPRYEDLQPLFHKVEPYRIQYRRGHWYLRCYDLYRRYSDGREKHNIGHRSFRLAYILNDQHLKVLPAKLPSSPRPLPRYQVHYHLAPAVGRGAISRHFEEMKIMRLPDGSAEVLGLTDSPWEAVRILLRYGENCTVLGGPEVKKLMLKQVRGLARIYGFVG